MENTFKQFGLKSEIEQAVEKLGFKNPTEIQAKVLPEVLNNQNVIGQSHTGSGKTHAYLLPLCNKIDETRHEVQMVITAPTRELAIQLSNEIKKLIEFAGKQDVWRSRLLIGGTDPKKQAEKLKNTPHIIVGTPGRILDMIKREALSIYTATSFVIDEADLMIDLGFMNDVDQLLVRSQRDIQLLVFSATIPERLQAFLKKYLEQPVYVKIENGLSPETMDHQLISLRHRKPSTVIMELSEMIQPYLAIIFANTKEEADVLADELISNGLNVGLLHGGLTPRERKRMLKDLEQLKYQYIVATDLASRGIDIKGVSHVINAQLPKEEAFYIHRVGRTARAGMQGTAISLYEEEDTTLIEKLESKGLNFVFTDIKNGKWTEAHPWNKRTMRQQNTTDFEKEAWKQVPKSKKVKPGYKKKMKQKQQSIKRQLKKEQFHKGKKSQRK